MSIGNVHGSTAHAPTLDLDRLRAIRDVTEVPLVLHGGSGLDDVQLRAAIALGIRKVNVNTELRGRLPGSADGRATEELVDTCGTRHGGRSPPPPSQVIERLGSRGLLVQVAPQEVGE